MKKIPTKIPKTMRAVAIVKKADPKFTALDIYSFLDGSDVVRLPDEILCEVEISFVKYIKS